MGEFFHAVRVFGDHLAAVEWTALAIALGLPHRAARCCGAIAWRTILRAAYPGKRVRFRSAFGAYVAGVGVNSIAPARGGDVVKLYLIKHRIKDSTYATLTPTLARRDASPTSSIAGALIVWALSIGVLPAHQVYSRLPSVDWGFLIEHRECDGRGRC